MVDLADISSIDRNFATKTSIDMPDVKFYDVEQAPFKVYGVFLEDGQYRRMPQAVASTVNDGVLRLHTNTAGGRVRFCTDSPYVALHADMGFINRLPHCAAAGTGGFDLYVDGRHLKTFVPTATAQEDGIEGIVGLDGVEGMHEILIHFPTYSHVKRVYIGLADGAHVAEPTPYRNEKPVVYYGSSITQGGCASRPGMCYTNILSRQFNCDHINLGFSGSALGEDAMAEYLCGLDMSVFVCDYDHNADVRQLRETHEKLYKAVRAAHPDIPIVIMGRPKYTLSEAELPRVDILTATYEHARANGDNVYLLLGEELMAWCRDEGTVDNTHPNDFGFASMAHAVAGVFEKIYGETAQKP